MKHLLILILTAIAPEVYAAALRVATVQFESIDGEFSRNLDEATKYVLQAHEKDAKIVLLPEFSLV